MSTPDYLRSYDEKLADDEWLAGMVKVTGAGGLANRAMRKLIQARALLREARDDNWTVRTSLADRIRSFLDGGEG